MKILVIDDNPAHLEAAKQTLDGHDLTLLNTYDEADSELTKIKGVDKEKYDVVLLDLLMPAGKRNMGPDGQKYIGQEIPVGIALALRAVLAGAKYVAVVTATNHHVHPASAMIDELDYPYWKEKDESSKPYYVGEWNDKSKPRFIINGSVVGFFHHPEYLVQEMTCPKCNGTNKNPNSDDRRHPRCPHCNEDGLPLSKNWGKVLERLLEGVK